MSTPGARPPGRRAFGQRNIAVRLVFLVVFLVAVLAFHASGSTLVFLRVARLVLVVAIIGGLGMWRRSRR